MAGHTHIRVIGDIHQCKGRNYLNLISFANYSVQLGDLGWHRLDDNNEFLRIMTQVDPTRHRVVTGNHDLYDNLTPHHLGDCGVCSFPLKSGTFDFFFIRGARSIDTWNRLPGTSWWPELEELNWLQGRKAVELFEEVKPRTVFSHDCPEEIGILMDFFKGDKPSRTNQILQTCFDVHKPELWVFGHHHHNFRRDVKGTTFMCLDGKLPESGHEVGYIDFDSDGHLLTPIPQ